MTDSTVYAEALIAAVARAFYEDEAVCLIDVLLRDKYLRDDDMGPRLSLPAKQLRKTMQLLQDEHLVKYELVDDLSQGGSQATKFWYVDYNHAVNVIRLRIYLLRKKLEEAELRARSSSMYLCPGYHTGVCNGRYTETEAQQVVDPEMGLFLCHECVQQHMNNPDPPPRSTYTLKLVDNTKDLKAAMDNMRRLSTQLSAKDVGNQRLRVGIYDLLQKVRQSKGPLSSNLPSENRAHGIGSKRLEGTGRTFNIRARKIREQQGVHHRSAALESTKRSAEGSDLNFLKNAMGEEIAFYVERGGGAKANRLSRGRKKTGKIMDAADKFCRRIPDDGDAALAKILADKKKKKAETAKSSGKRPDGTALPDGPSFLLNNIGDPNFGVKAGDDDDDENDDDDDVEDMEEEVLKFSPAAAQRNMTDEERQALFHSQYVAEVARQRSLLNIVAGGEKSTATGGLGAAGGVDANAKHKGGAVMNGVKPMVVEANGFLGEEAEMMTIWEDG